MSAPIPGPPPPIYRFLNFQQTHRDEADRITAEEWARRFGLVLSPEEKLRINILITQKRAQKDWERYNDKEMAKLDMENADTPSEYQQEWEIFRNIPPSDVDDAKFVMRGSKGLALPYSQIQRKRPRMLGLPGQ